jgi:hypothetical protein
MLRIQRFVNEESISFVLSGRIETENVAQLESLLTAESKSVALDLKEVSLVSREVVQFLRRCENDGITITNCPAYIRHWIARE